MNEKHYIEGIGEVEQSSWNKVVKTMDITFWGKKTNVSVVFYLREKNKIALTNLQKKIYYALINDMDNVIKKMEERIYDYYTRFVLLENPSYIMPGREDKLPEIHSIYDMSKIVKIDFISIDDEDESDFTDGEDDEDAFNVDVFFDTMWDDLNGLVIWLKRNEIYDIGNGAEF